MKVLNELRQFYPLDELLRAAEIPRSTFYYHLKALSKPDKYADVKKRISEIYHENRGRYCLFIEKGNRLTIKLFSA